MTFNIINPSSSSFRFSVSSYTECTLFFILYLTIRLRLLVFNICDFLRISFSTEEKNNKENLWQHVCYRLPCWLFVGVKH